MSVCPTDLKHTHTHQLLSRLWVSPAPYYGLYQSSKFPHSTTRILEFVYNSQCKVFTSRAGVVLLLCKDINGRWNFNRKFVVTKSLLRRTFRMTRNISCLWKQTPSTTPCAYKSVCRRFLYQYICKFTKSLQAWRSWCPKRIFQCRLLLSFCVALRFSYRFLVLWTASCKI